MGGKLYASLYYQNQVVVADPEKGEAIGQLPIDHPAGLAADKLGRLYAVSGKQVLRLDGQQWVPTVTAGLAAPVGLAVDAQGNLYVSDWADAMCVKVFSPDGRLLRAIGKPGGRPLQGPYDPAGSSPSWGIAVDAQSRLWVAEHDLTPRRISVWDAGSGQFVREFCGTTWYSAVGARVNPLNPRQAFVLGNTCELDWDKGLWRVTGTLSHPTDPASLIRLNSENLTAMDVLRVKDRDILVASGGHLMCVAELHPQSARLLAAMGDVYCALRDRRRVARPDSEKPGERPQRARSPRKAVPVRLQRPRSGLSRRGEHVGAAGRAALLRLGGPERRRARAGA